MSRFYALVIMRQVTSHRGVIAAFKVQAINLEIFFCNLCTEKCEAFENTGTFDGRAGCVTFCLTVVLLNASDMGHQ